MAKKSSLKDIVKFISERKLWWLVPVILAILVFGIVLFLASSSPAAPFIYTFF